MAQQAQSPNIAVHDTHMSYVVIIAVVCRIAVVCSKYVVTAVSLNHCTHVHTYIAKTRQDKTISAASSFSMRWAKGLIPPGQANLPTRKKEQVLRRCTAVLLLLYCVTYLHTPYCMYFCWTQPQLACNPKGPARCSTARQPAALYCCACVIYGGRTGESQRLITAAVLYNNNFESAVCMYVHASLSPAVGPADISISLANDLYPTLPYPTASVGTRYDKVGCGIVVGQTKQLYKYIHFGISSFTCQNIRQFF